MEKLPHVTAWNQHTYQDKNHHIASFKYTKFILSKDDDDDDLNKYCTARLVYASIHVHVDY